MDFYVVQVYNPASAHKSLTQVARPRISLFPWYRKASHFFYFPPLMLFKHTRAWTSPGRLHCSPIYLVSSFAFSLPSRHFDLYKNCAAAVVSASSSSCIFIRQTLLWPAVALMLGRGWRNETDNKSKHRITDAPGAEERFGHMKKTVDDVFYLRVDFTLNSKMLTPFSGSFTVYPFNLWRETVAFLIRFHDCKCAPNSSLAIVLV